MTVTPYAWKAMSSVDDWMKQNGKMKCRQKCGSCSRTWKQTRTNFVNYLYSPPDPKPLFICDLCLNSLADEIIIKS